MTAADLIAEFEALGIELIPDPERGKIRYRPASAVPADLRERLLALKPEVLAALTSPTTAELARSVPSAPSSSPWPTNIPNLGARKVIAFSPCIDCEIDPPEDDMLKVGVYEIAVPGPRRTFVAYGDLALCRRHARGRQGGTE
jgi:hypothetical protein